MFSTKPMMFSLELLCARCATVQLVTPWRATSRTASTTAHADGVRDGDHGRESTMIQSNLVGDAEHLLSGAAGEVAARSPTLPPGMTRGY